MRNALQVRRLIIPALALVLSSAAWAQSRTTSALTGTVKGQDGGVVAGATVTVESPQLIGGAQSAVTDSKGQYRFTDIAPGTYTVSVVMPGYKTLKREEVRLPVGITLDLPISITAFAGEETVTVTGEPPAIDVTSTETKVYLPNEILQNVPTNQFQPDTLNLAPGITDSVAWGGAADTGVAWAIDGVDTSDPEAGSAWSFVNYNIIDQVELAGLGAPAEYGGFTGVVFNSTTKSGSNDFHGLVDIFYNNDDFVSSNDAPAGINPTEKKYLNTTANFGGPFIKDKLWWYVSAQYYNLVSNNGGPDRNEESPRAFGKLTWQINANNLFDAWIEWDRYDIIGRGGDAITPLEATVREDAPEFVWNFNWKRVFNKDTILNVTFQGYDGYYYLDPEEGYGIAGRYDAIEGLYNTNSVYYYLADRDRNQLNATLTRHVSDWGGAHDFKFGMEIERSGLRSRYGYPTGVKYYDNYYGDDPSLPGYDPYAPDYYTTAYFGNSYDIHATNGRVTAYVQDDWQITPRFTINPGVRFDYIQGKVPGLGKVYDNLNIAPRLGFAWNITGDNKNLIKAHVGRYYAGARGVYYYWVDPGAFTPGRIDTQWVSGFTETGDTRTKTFEIDPNLNHPYMDQFTLGYDRALPWSMVVSFTGIYRKWKDFVETVAANPDFTPVTGEVGVLDPATGDYVSTGQTVTLFDWNNWDTDSLLVTNPDGLEREYKGGMITLTKNFRNNWQAMASYVYSETTGTIDNVGFDASSDSGGQDGGPSPFLDTPNSKVNWDGHLTYDPTNQLKISGTYLFSGINLWLTGSYTYYTGTTYTKKSECLLSNDDGDPLTNDCHSFPQEGIARVRYFSEERGSRRLDPFNELNARVEWKPKLWKGNLGVMVDAFNLLNDSRVTERQDRDNGDFDLVTEHNIGRRFRLGLRYEF
jgi:outer membrane receptor protein involved in Fe transport